MNESILDQAKKMLNAAPISEPGKAPEKSPESPVNPVAQDPQRLTQEAVERQKVELPIEVTQGNENKSANFGLVFPIRKGSANDVSVGRGVKKMLVTANKIRIADTAISQTRSVRRQILNLLLPEDMENEFDEQVSALLDDLRALRASMELRAGEDEESVEE
jgi:hypothetical protein